MAAGARIYISSAFADPADLRNISRHLVAAGFRLRTRPNIALLPGERWQKAAETIEEVIEHSDFVLVLLSPDRRPVGPEAEWQFEHEMQAAHNKISRMSTKKTFLIPVRTSSALVPSPLRDIQPADLFEPNGWAQLLTVLGHTSAPLSEQAAHQAQPPDPPEELVRACLEGHCVLYIGAGFSAAAGFPTRTLLVEKLLDWSSEQGFIDPGFSTSLHTALSMGNTGLVADSIVGTLQTGGHDAALHEYLRTLFAEVSPELTDSHRLLRHLNAAAVFTTNFDALLEQTYPQAADHIYAPQDTEPLLNALTTREFFLLKLYGMLHRPETVLMTPAQYQDLLVENRAFAEFMESLLLSKTLLFLGTSLEGIQEYLRSTKLRSPQHRHYALVAVSGNAWQAQAEILLRRYGVEVLPYPESAEHPEVPAFLQALVSRMSAHAGQLDDGPGRHTRQEPARLLRVRFTNIGPFDTLELRLSPTWNVVLGDNGVGKSILLKAIAVAMCGREAQPYAERLIKVGATSSRIVLETNTGQEYVTELFRTSTSVALDTLPGRFLDTEGCLAIGFPAMRFMSWQPFAGPQLAVEKPRPVPADLLPLLTGNPDPRIDEFKQVLVTLDYQIAKATGDEAHSARHYEQLREALFHIMTRITSGMKLEFHEVDMERRQVMVKTHDGTVPLEAVSQGTASLLGWTSVVVQRLYDVFGHTEQPLQQPAIVLIDEIDAHMHPQWQQALVGNLSALFPQVQFLVTTHSPLIVGGLAVEQVLRFARDTAGKVIRIDVPPDMSMGRTDQILTSRLFGLETTLDTMTQQHTARYHQLLGQAQRSPEEEDEMQQLRQTLAFRIPVSPETPAERRAQELLRALMQQQLGESYPEVQQMLLDKAAQLLTEVQARTGGQR